MVLFRPELVLFARGLINVFVTDGSMAMVGMNAVLPSFFPGLGVTVLEALSPLLHRFCTERLQDEMNIRDTSDILSHSEHWILRSSRAPESVTCWIAHSKIPPNLS